MSFNYYNLSVCKLPTSTYSYVVFNCFLLFTGLGPVTADHNRVLYYKKIDTPCDLSGMNIIYKNRATYVEPSYIVI
jgi:hypothetical protein